MFPIAGIAGSALESILGMGSQSRANNVSGASASTITDSNQLSPFAQVASELQQLQQSNPAQYAQATSQIAANLQTAAQTAQSQGNTGAANSLNQLATDFTNASTSGQLPNFQDLARAVGGHHHHLAEASATNPLSIIQTTLGQ
jgi:hypothetical protein